MKIKLHTRFMSCACVLFALPLSMAKAEPIAGTAQTLNPRALAVAGAMVASAGGTSGVYLNPATISMAPLYHFEGMYQFSVREKMHMGGIAAADSITSNIVGAGLSFNYAGIDQSRTKHSSYDARLSLSGAVGSRFFLGVTGRYLRLEQNLDSGRWGPVGKPALPASGSQQVDGFTFDVGAAAKLGDIFSLGVAGYNLTHTESVFAPIRLAAGGAVSLVEILQVEADAVTDFTTYDKPAVELRIGGELFLANSVAIRGGYRFEFRDKHNTISAGLGYIHARFSMEAGFSQEIRASGPIAFSVGLKYFVN